MAGAEQGQTTGQRRRGMRTRRLSAAALAIGLATSLTGCALFQPAASTPEGQAVAEWFELLCEGRYSEANALSSRAFEMGDRSYVDLEASLSRADEAASMRLSELRDAGVDVEPRIQIDATDRFGDYYQQARVVVSGECYGEPLTANVFAVEEGEGWQIFDRIPLISTMNLVREGRHSFPYVGIEIASGAFVENIDPLDSGWLLPPGSHTITVPEHFLMGDAMELPVEVSLFQVTEAPPEVSFRTDAAEDAMVTFREECQGLCAIPAEGVSEYSINSATPLEVTPLEVDASGQASFSGTVMVLREGDVNIPWRAVRPRDWGLETPNTGEANLKTPINQVAEFTCPEGETCTLTAEEVKATGNGIETIYLTEIDGEVQVAGFKVE